jgi:hypothetical protein
MRALMWWSTEGEPLKLCPLSFTKPSGLTNNVVEFILWRETTQKI